MNLARPLVVQLLATWRGATIWRIIPGLVTSQWWTDHPHKTAISAIWKGADPTRSLGSHENWAFEDRSGLPPSAPEKTESVERSVDGLMQLVEEVESSRVKVKSPTKDDWHSDMFFFLNDCNGFNGDFFWRETVACFQVLSFFLTDFLLKNPALPVSES